ncbi:VTT domain-containing protein [Pseudoflavonifractor phocaeensis]|uniref:TVP38/TMEM64 family protein n=1 Tax=Pseudoflavonifractor phocaeensis TaxID=1870988 RepID=UPI00313E5A94
MKAGKERITWGVTLVITLVLLALLVFLLWSSGFFAAIGSPGELRRYIERFTPYSHFVFFAIQLASVILAPIPSNLTAAVGGLLFGTLPAFLLTAGAVTLGSVIVFQLGRTLGRPFAERFISRRNLEKYGEVIRRKRDVFLFLAFLFPFFPDDLICIMAGLTDVPFRRFLVLVAVARPWGLLVASALGGSALSIPLWGMVLLDLGGLALFLWAMKYGDRFEEAVLRRLKK